MSVPPKDHNPYGAPHLSHELPIWAPRAEKLEKKLLSWTDVKQMSVFGRYGYFLANFLFAAVPIAEPVLEIWVRLTPEEAAELASNPRASVHEHPVKGWMRLRVDEDAHVDEAVTWLEKAYKNAAKVWDAGWQATPKPNPEGGTQMPLGAPIHLVPESTSKRDHRIPQGPPSGKLVTGLASEGAAPQPATN